MAAQRWLNIVVDGNAALGPYWPTVVSEFLGKIVRCFCDNSREQGANNAACELGLVMYNANSDLGCDFQFIHWTRDVDQFLGRLSCLAFNGDGLNQFAMAEGLAEALVMYPRPRTGTSTREYFNGERHCILVATGDPVPKKMPVPLPKIREGEFVGTQIESCKADFLEVAQMFTPLAVSLSVITPEQLPIFRAIFNLANNISRMANVPLSNYRIGQFIVLLSRNFKEARYALHEKRIVGSSTERSIETDIALSKVLTPGLSLSEDIILHGKELTVSDSQQTIEAAKAARLELKSVTSGLESQLVVPNAIDLTQVSSSSSLSLMDVYGDIMAELNADNDIVLPRKKPKTCITLDEDNLNELFQPNQLPLDDIGDSLGQQQTMYTKKKTSMEALRAIEADFEQALLGTPQNISKNQTSMIDLTANSSKEVKSSQPVVPKAPTASAGTRSPIVLLEPRGNMGVLNPFISSGNCSTSAFLPQNSSSWWPVDPQAQYGGVQSTSGVMSTSVRLGIIDAWDTQVPAAGVAFGSMSPRAMANSIIQPSSSSRLQMFPDITSQLARGPWGSFSGLIMEPNLLGDKRDLMTAFGPPPTPAAGASFTLAPVQRMPQITHPGLFLPPPSTMDYQPDYVYTWEVKDLGSIRGILQPNNVSHNKAKAYCSVDGMDDDMPLHTTEGCETYKKHNPWLGRLRAHRRIEVQQS